MIRLTRLNGSEFVLNSELIKFMEETPDTVITLVNGERVLVSENMDDIVGRVVDYGKRVRVFAQD